MMREKAFRLNRGTLTSRLSVDAHFSKCVHSGRVHQLRTCAGGKRVRLVHHDRMIDTRSRYEHDGRSAGQGARIERSAYAAVRKTVAQRIQPVDIPDRPDAFQGELVLTPRIDILAGRRAKPESVSRIGVLYANVEQGHRDSEAATSG